MGKRNERPIALVGMMGAGKSVVAQILGERLGASVADLDSMIEAMEGCSIAELFERSGEAHFRQREGELLERVLGAGVRVVACGGGIVLDPTRRALLRERCFVAWLDVTPAEALRRVSASGAPGHVRPLLAGDSPGERLASILAARAPLYAEVAHVRVPTTGRSLAQVADGVLDAVAAAAGPGAEEA